MPELHSGRPAPALDEGQTAELADTFRLMGEGSRLRIVLACLGEPVCVSDIAERLGLSGSLVSHHLRLLRAARLLRPQRRGRQIFYSVADEHLLADPDAPPSYLVDLYKALGDERRLRMLAILGEGDAGLMEIADRVDLAKSTTHHHLRILRSAGLVRVTVGENKSYSLRREGGPEAARLLDAYLMTPAAAAAASEPERN